MRKSNLLDVSDQENALVSLLQKPKLSKDDEHLMGYLFSGILTQYFASIGWRNWVVDDMYPDSVNRDKNKLTVIGRIHWLKNGGECKEYQIDISLDALKMNSATGPLLYSIKLKNKHGDQIFYIGKTLEAWVMKEA